MSRGHRQRRRPNAGDEIQNPQRDGLREWTRIPHGADARRAAVLTLAPGNQRLRPREQAVVHPEQRFAEADAAWIVVVDENARLVGQLGRLAAPRQIRVVSLLAAADRNADVL